LDRHFDSCEEDRGVAKWLVGQKRNEEGAARALQKYFALRLSIRLIGTATATGDLKV